LKFSTYLKSCREKNNLTQEALVHDLYSYDIENFRGLDTSTIGKWERGATQPKTLRQVSILKYFQEKTGIALPCFTGYTEEEAEALICRTGIHNLLGKNKHIIYNFPSEMMSVDDIKVYPLRNLERMDSLIESAMHFQHTDSNDFNAMNHEQTREWALHPDSLFLVCEYKTNFLGWFFCTKIKPEVFNQYVNFEIKKSEITVNDFASHEEKGSILMGSFFAMNDKAATMMLIRFYAHLIANQSTIVEMGGSTTLEEAKKIVTKMNLQPYHTIITEEKLELESYRQTLANVLVSEHAVQMLLSKQECPKE